MYPSTLRKMVFRGAEVAVIGRIGYRGGIWRPSSGLSHQSWDNDILVSGSLETTGSNLCILKKK